MSPVPFVGPPSAAVGAAIARLWPDLGRRVRDARLARHWTTSEIARRSGLSRTSIYTLERGEAVSLEVAVRVATALGLRLTIDLEDHRRRERHDGRGASMRDVVHSAMGDLEARRLSSFGFGTGLDEPYQHFQFAGRADLIAWDVPARALLHLENRTRFPDLQEIAGSYNAKRAYLAAAVAQRIGISRWASETHAMVCLWSAEVLHVLRLRTASFRALCPDPATSFTSWWSGSPVSAGKTSTFVLLDPLAQGRQRAVIDLETALSARRRYDTYAEAAAALAAANR